MKGLVLTVAAIGIVAVIVTTRSRSAPASSSPAPTAIEDQISFRDDAGLFVRVRSQIDAMKQLEAMGNAPQAAAPILAANEALRRDQETIADRHRQAGGASPLPAGWDEFLRLDAALRASPP